MPPGFRLSATLLTGVFLLVAASVVHVTSGGSANAQQRPVGSRPAVATKPGATATRPDGLVVETGIRSLPGPVQEMRDAILAAVRSGRIEDLKTAIELNEMKPIFGDGAVADPIAFLKRASADGEGREVLAALGNVLAAGWVAVPLGRDLENNRIYVWPHFAETGVTGLSPAREVELMRLVPASEAKAMISAGRYTFWRLAIGADGTWHALQKAEPGKP